MLFFFPPPHKVGRARLGQPSLLHAGAGQPLPWLTYCDCQLAEIAACSLLLRRPTQPWVAWGLKQRSLGQLERKWHGTWELPSILCADSAHFFACGLGYGAPWELWCLSLTLGSVMPARLLMSRVNPPLNKSSPAFWSHILCQDF